MTLLHYASLPIPIRSNRPLPPQTTLHHTLPPLREIQDLPVSARLLSRKHKRVAPDDIFERAADELLLRVGHARPMVLDPVDREDELARQPVIAAAVTAACDVRPVHLAGAGREVLHRDGLAVGVDLAARAVDVRVAVADLLGVRDHVEDGGFGTAASERLLGVVAGAWERVVVPGHRHHLVVADIVVGLPDAAAVPVPGRDFGGWRRACVVLGEFGEEGAFTAGRTSLGNALFDFGQDNVDGPVCVS